MSRVMFILVLGLLAPVTAHADWCDPPIAPELTTTELARDFRNEFAAEFEQYFSDASAYTACLDAERVRVFEEMKVTTDRYARFLDDAQTWEPIDLSLIHI